MTDKLEIPIMPLPGSLAEFIKLDEMSFWKEYAEQLEKRYGYLRENFECEVQKRVDAYARDAHSELTKEIEYWMRLNEKLLKIINTKENDKE